MLKISLHCCQDEKILRFTPKICISYHIIMVYTLKEFAVGALLIISLFYLLIKKNELFSRVLDKFLSQFLNTVNHRNFFLLTKYTDSRPILLHLNFNKSCLTFFVSFRFLLKKKKNFLYYPKDKKTLRNPKMCERLMLHSIEITYKLFPVISMFANNLTYKHIFYVN